MKNDIKNQSRFVKNPSKIDPKTIPDRWKYVLGAVSAPNRAQVGSRTLRAKWGTPLFMDYWNIIWVYGSIFGAPGNRRSLQNRTFEGQLGLWPSKMPSGRGFGKNMKIWWKIDVKWSPTKGKIIKKPLVFIAKSYFRHFQKNSKNQCQKGSPKSCFWWKMAPRAPKVRFILSFLLFFEGSKNHSFFDADLVSPKS